MALALQFNGYQVVEAANGEEAVRIATELVPDLIVMDVRMPKMNGYEACQILKQQDSTRDIPIVFLSAKGQDTDQKAGLALGAEAYWLKPFDPTDMPQRIGEILKKYSQP